MKYLIIFALVLFIKTEKIMITTQERGLLHCGTGVLDSVICTGYDKDYNSFTIYDGTQPESNAIIARFFTSHDYYCKAIMGIKFNNGLYRTYSNSSAKIYFHYYQQRQWYGADTTSISRHKPKPRIGDTIIISH